jgi:RHS repeat-associated protein
MLDDLGLVHMNGRIYDPLLGRFLSADLQVQFPDNLQSYNRYSYVQNNPLTFFDPSGWGLSPANAAMGWNRGIPENHNTPAQQRALDSGANAAPFTFLVHTGSMFGQAVLSPGGMPSPAALDLAFRTENYLSEAKTAIMKADGVDPALGNLWSLSNSNNEVFIGLTAGVAMSAAPLLSVEGRLAVTTPELKLLDSVPTKAPSAAVESGSGEMISLWKGPAKYNDVGALRIPRSPAAEVSNGFDPALYPGNGPYFGVGEAGKAEALSWAKYYGNGFQEIQLPKAAFDSLLERGAIKWDTLYDAGTSVHVPAEGLPTFNSTITGGTYHLPGTF